MEIFSNIWNVLTTENEILTKIIVSPTVVIEAWLSLSIITAVLKLNISNNQKYIYILFLSALSLLTEFVIPEPYNIFINYITLLIFAQFLFNLNIVKTVLCTIIPPIVFGLCTSLFLKIFLKILNISYINIVTVPIYRLIFLSVLYLLILITIIIAKKKSLKISILEDLTSSNKKIILLNLISGFIILSIQATLTVFYMSIVPIIITLLNFIALILYFFIIFYSLNKTMRLQITSEDLENAENFNTTLSYLYDNVKAFKHDFDNMVFIIGGYIQNNDLDGLKKYYKNFEKDCERVNELALLNPELINNPGIYNLLMSKYKKATDNNVEIHLEYFFDLNKLKMPIYEFSRILGILLDNALEAAKDSKEKQVNIMFRDSQRNNTQIISIENSYNNKDVDTSLIFEKGQTSKENHTGMGLWEVKQLLNRNNNVNLITTKDKIYFKQTIEIYY